MKSNEELMNQIITMLSDAFNKKFESYLEKVGKWNFINNLIVLAEWDDGFDILKESINQKIDLSDAIQMTGMIFEPHRVLLDENGEIEIHIFFHLEEGEIFEDELELDLVYKDKKLQLYSHKDRTSRQYELEYDLQAIHDQIENNLFKEFLGG